MLCAASGSCSAPACVKRIGSEPKNSGVAPVCRPEDYDEVLRCLRDEGFVRPGITVEPDELREYLGPFIEPAFVDSFRFSREWMRAQFQRMQDPRQPGSMLAMRLNLPPEYLLIHRVWVGCIGVLSQLEAELRFADILEEWLPGFAEG